MKSFERQNHAGRSVFFRWRRAMGIALLCSAGLLVACASTPTSDIRVQSASDAKANLTAYKSYAWYDSASVLHDDTGVWTGKDVDARAEVQFLVDKALQERDMHLAREQPDLFVAMLIAADVKDVEEIKAERGAQLTTFDPVGRGALVIELIDAETGKTVWLGGAIGELRGSRTLEESKKRLAYAVDKLFELLPR